jgi:hypothetical protein
MGALFADIFRVDTMVENGLVLLGANATNLVGDTLGDQVQICWLVRIGDSTAEAA